MKVSPRYYEATVWYEFMAGIVKLSHDDKDEFSTTLDNVLKALTVFKDDPIYKQFQQFSGELKKDDLPLVLSTETEALKAHANLDGVVKGLGYRIICGYLDDLHRILLGGKGNHLAEYVQQYRVYRRELH